MARIILPLVILSLCAGSAAAQVPEANLPGFTVWMQKLEQDALADGVAPATVHNALDNAMLDDRIVALDRQQPETTATFASYAAHIVDADRVARGRQMLAQHDDALKKISAQYGVPPDVIVALWGIESRFGRYTGKYNIVDSLVTLAYEGRRADFFRRELLDALHILDQERMPATALRGSWAGAMGQCQFMPSTYLRYAVDYHQAGQRDIWNDTEDVLASIANYLAAEGWKPGQPWGFEVKTTKPVPDEKVGLSHTAALSAWRDAGIDVPDGTESPDDATPLSLIQPDGAEGRSFLVYDNYRALMRWNRSTYFATAVGLLADRIK